MTDAQQLIEADTEVLSSLLHHAGFTFARYTNQAPYLEHRQTGVTIHAEEDGYLIHYPAAHAPRNLATVELTRQTTHRAAAEVACALRLVLGQTHAG
ncbi:hypothetical protein GCM10027258_92800 [Amycolatopsis stemonae]